MEGAVRQKRRGSKTGGRGQAYRKQGAVLQEVRAVLQNGEVSPTERKGQ